MVIVSGEAWTPQVLPAKFVEVFKRDPRAGYARQLAAGSAHITWPPERNGPCWCGSGNKYKKCCLPRSRS